jgi:hypothetical protein
MPDTPAAALVVIFGGYTTTVFTRAFYLGWASTRWPRVTGHVRDSIVSVIELGLRQGPSRLGSAASVSYDYEVRDRSFTGNRIRFGPEWWLLAGRDSRAYPPGSAVTVAYDPRSPHQSVLRPGITLSNALSLPIGIAFLVSGTTWLMRSLVAG